MEDLKAGELAFFDILNRYISADGFTLVSGLLIDGKGTLYEMINLGEYPSFNDFKGYSRVVTHGDPCTVLRKVGRPFKISKLNRWGIYDVYEVLTVKSDKLQVFRYNLSRDLSLF